MKKKIPKIFGVALTLVMVLSLTVAFAPAATVSADEYDVAEWDKYEVPKDGKTGDYVLYDCDVGPIAVDSAGTIYAAVWNEDDDVPELFKSDDDGHTWELLEEYTDPDDDEIVDIVISPVDDDVIYVADEDSVYKSTDAGEEWRGKATVDGDGDDITDITSLDVSYYNDAYILLIGAYDDDESNAEVFFFDEGETIGAWADLNVVCSAVSGGDINQLETVLDVAFSPNFEDDRQFVAVVEGYAGDPIYEWGVWVVTTFGGGAWGGEVGDSDFDTATALVADPIPCDDADTAKEVMPWRNSRKGER